MSHELTAYLSVFDLFFIMAILSEGFKPDNFESHNSLKRSFANIRGVPLKSLFLESNFPDIRALCGTNLDDSIDTDNFAVGGLSSFNPEGYSTTHMHSLAVSVKEGLPFARELTLENSVYSYLCFRLALLHLVSYFFFLYR